MIKLTIDPFKGIAQAIPFFFASKKLNEYNY
jgi:hypothetical protein